MQAIIPQVEPQTLFTSGYRAYVADGSLIIRNPDKTRYMINLYAKSCTCKDFQYNSKRYALYACKHLRGCMDIVWDSMTRLGELGREEERFALCDEWFKFSCAVRVGKTEGMAQYVERVQNAKVTA